MPFDPHVMLNASTLLYSSRNASRCPMPVSNKPTILVVDNHADFVETLGHLLSSAGHKSFGATTGLDAILVFKQHHSEIDLLLVDVVMPEMSGPELLDCLRSLKSDLKVLFMSGYDRLTVSAVRGFSWNHPFIQKPFEATALQKKISLICHPS